MESSGVAPYPARGLTAYSLPPVAALPDDLARGLREKLSLQRAVETGTHIGAGAEILAQIFSRVVSIEVSERFHAEAARRLENQESIELLLGDSLDLLPGISDAAVPTFYWLDGHWSGGETGAGSVECPVLGEISCLSSGHPDDCIVVDDARMFAVAASPPFDPTQWPSIIEVLDTLRAARPEHHVTIAADFVIAVPQSARETLDTVARRWMTHQGWRTTDVPMEMTDDGWVMDRAYKAQIEELVQQQLASELENRTLRARLGNLLGRG